MEGNSSHGDSSKKARRILIIIAIVIACCSDYIPGPVDDIATILLAYFAPEIANVLPGNKG